MTDNRIVIAIVDDDSIALATIKSFVQSFFRQKRILTEIRTYASGELLFQERTPFDLILCDILLPGENGIEIVKKYLSGNPETQIVFVSNREDKIFDSMKIHPLSFVRKEHFFEDITNALSYYLTKIRDASPEHALIVKCGMATKRIPISHILYIEAKQHNQIIHTDTKEGQIVAKENMKFFIQELAKYGFIHCHKSFLVNFLFIRAIENNTIVLTNDDVIYVSKRRIRDVKKEFLKRNMEDFN